MPGMCHTPHGVRVPFCAFNALARTCTVIRLLDAEKVEGLREGTIDGNERERGIMKYDRRGDDTGKERAAKKNTQTTKNA